MKMTNRVAGVFVPAAILVTATAILLTSCMKKEQYPDIPEIAFQSFTLAFDTNNIPRKGYLTISFKDGDGDIGLHPGDTLSPYQKGGAYYYNYVIDYYEKQNGVFVLVPLNPPYHARIPYLTPDDPTKAIKGFIVDTLQMNPYPVFDTIKLKFFIYDRALHKSNTDSTPPIILRRF
jgi:hypothetical protein